MISIRNVSKTFASSSGSVEALKEVSLEIGEGEIYGVIGLSGAGKSTLARCINLLERPDSGSVNVDGMEMTSLSPRELRGQRRGIGMIFQQFNLMPSRTVWGNIAYPLKKAGLGREETDKRVRELLRLVGLEDKINAYPRQLSGGQKQRVAIARAIAVRPKVLICDEATSALDPATTLSILALLKQINREMGITMVVITHEMAVVKEICDRVAVMEHGRIVEEGSALSVFASPRSEVAASFVESASGAARINRLLDEKSPAVRIEKGQVLAKLTYMGTGANEALISQASRRFGVDCNIIFGNMEVVQDTTIGVLVLAFSGEKESITAAAEFLSRNNVIVEVIDR